MSAISRDRSSKSTSARSSKSSKKVVFAGRPESTHDSDYAREDSVMDMVDTEPLDRPETVGDELELMDLPPPPTTAHSDTLYSSLTIYTPGDQIVNIHKMGGIKRGSCEWTNTNIPCINKLASHLSNLQRQLDAPKKAITDNSRLGSLIGPTPGEPMLKVTSYDANYNKGLELIEEIKTLMNRLETDRQQTITVYQREVERVKLLQLQVDQVERKRLYILPKAVQLEHEACAQDISELKWDLENWLEDKAEIEVKVKTAVEENKTLQCEIKRLEDQCPRIGEKLDIDKTTLADISDNLRESKMALNYTMEGLRKVKLKYEKAKQQLQNVHSVMDEAKNKSLLADGRAESERVQLRAELANIRKTLSGVQTELKEAQEINATHNADISELNRAIHQAENEGAELDNDIEKAKEEERQAQERVNFAKIDLLEIAENIKGKRRANTRLTQQMAAKFNFVKTELENRDRKQQRTLRFDKSMLREALQTTVRMEREIIDFKKELTVSIKKARDDEKATSRAQAELKHLDQQLHVVVEEVQKLAEQNARLSLDAHRTEEDIVNTETALKNNLTMLRKTLQDEIQAKTSLSNKMMSEQEDFDKYQNDSSRKLARTEKKKDDLEEVHNKYTEEKDGLTESLDAIHKERDKLNASVARTQSILATEKAQLEKQIEMLKPEEKEVREEMEGTQKAIDDLQWRCNMVSKKVQETLDASKVVMKIQKQTEDNIADLTLKIERLEAELVDGQEHEKSLQENLNHIKDNQLLSRNQYKASLDKRMKVFRELKESVEDEIEVNVTTSSKYNTLQAKHDQVKNDYQRALHIKLDLEMSVDDVSNVMRLQKRMHKALISYYMHRGYHNRIVLTDFGKGASMNLLQLEKVHRNLCEVINKTQGYLNKHGSGVARKQKRVPSPELRLADGDPNKLPILIETPPPPKQERRDSESSASDGRATGQGESMVTMD